MKKNSTNICDQYTRLTTVKITFIVFLIVLLMSVAFIAIAQGPSSLSFGDSFTALFDDSGTAHAIIWKLSTSAHSHGNSGGRRTRFCRGCISGNTQKPARIPVYSWNSLRRRVWRCARHSFRRWSFRQISYSRQCFFLCSPFLSSEYPG